MKKNLFKNFVIKVSSTLLLTSLLLSANTVDAQIAFEVDSTSFIPLSQARPITSDFDGDGDVDIALAGQDASGTSVSRTYDNDGSGNFTLSSNPSPIPGWLYIKASYGDVTGDGNQDILIAGATADKIALYKNDGNGGYSNLYPALFSALQTQEGVSHIWNPSAALIDFNADGSQDVIISGDTSSGNLNYGTFLFKNDGSGNFTLISNSSIDGHKPNSVKSKSIIVADINGDGKEDLLMRGLWQGQGFNAEVRIYLSNGDGTFIKASTNFDSTTGPIACLDINGDGNQDILICGTGNFSNKIEVYQNDGTGTNFAKLTNFIMNDAENTVQDPAMDLLDINGDGNQDILITGSNAINQNITQIYLNNSNSTFTQLPNTSLAASSTFFGVSVTAVDLGGTVKDFIICGKNPNSSARFSALYQNITPNLGVEKNKQQEVSIYPNPTHNTFTISSNKEVSEVEVRVYSPVGNLILKKKYSGLSTTIDLQGFSNGIYFVKLNQQQTIKVVKY